MFCVRAFQFIQWIHQNYPKLVELGQALPQSVNKQTNKGSDGAVMVKWWWSDGKWSDILF